MGTRLTRLDELPRHQAGGTFDTVVDSSPRWSDGFYFTTGDGDGDVALFSGLRLHPNTDVLDAFVCVSSRGRQHNARFSRRLRPRIDDLDVGPMSVEIVEGLRTLVTRCVPNPFGVAFELRWDGVAAPYNEERVQVVANGRLVTDRSNYDQCSVVTGWVEVDGRRVAVDGWTGVRDHSWGLGNNTGGPRTPAIAPAPAAPPAPFLRQWCVFRLPDRVVFWQFHRAAGGRLTKLETQCQYPYGDPREPFAYDGLSADVRWVERDGRPLKRLASCTVELDRPDGGTERYLVETLSDPVYLQGGGYWAGFDDGKGRGVYRGDEHGEGEVWDVSHPTEVGQPKGWRLQRDAYAETWGRCTSLDDPADTGTGHLECVALGAYPPFA